MREKQKQMAEKVEVEKRPTEVEAYGLNFEAPARPRQFRVMLSRDTDGEINIHVNGRLLGYFTKADGGTFVLCRYVLMNPVLNDEGEEEGVFSLGNYEQDWEKKEEEEYA